MFTLISTLKNIKEFQRKHPDSFFDVMVSDHLMEEIKRSPEGYFYFPFRIEFKADTSRLDEAVARLNEAFANLGAASDRAAKNISETLRDGGWTL